MQEKNENGQQGVQSVERTLLLLEQMSENSDGCSIKYLSETTGLHKSTVHRLLQTLVQYNYARQDPETEHYYLGFRILNLSTKLLNELDIITVAKPYLRSISRETGQVVQLSIPQEENAVFVDKVENPDQPVRMYSQIGKAIPMYCSSSGKALLAWQTEERIRMIIGNMEFTAFTRNTIPNAETLFQELIQIRQKGYATDWFEHEENIFCVAAPIMDATGQSVAAICIAGTVLQISPDQIVEYAQIINQNAFLISQQMGCIQYPAIFNKCLAKEDAQRVKAYLQNLYAARSAG